MRKPIIYILAIVTLMSAMLFSSCNESEKKQIPNELTSGKNEVNPAQIASPEKTTLLHSEEQASPTAAPEPSSTQAVFELHYEAEEAKLKGLDVFSVGENGIAEASGGGYVGTFGGKNKKLTFYVDVSCGGVYELVFYTSATDGESYNNVSVNGRIFYEALYTSGKGFEPYSLTARLSEGENEIVISAGWGGICIDCLEIKSSLGIDSGVYDVPKTLVNDNASNNTKRLMSYLVDIYGDYTLFGVYNYDKGVHCTEIEKLYELTGKYPSVIGFDFMDYSPSRVEYGAKTMQAEYAMEWGEMGGIVTIIWHWNAPKDLLDTKEQPWYRGFYTEATDFNLDKALSGEDEEGYSLLLRDIDAIADKLKPFAEKDIPILWRPLHEASGGWFWWGAYGAENYKKLWVIMYNRLTYTHGLNNLIWVSNSQNADWYPGDKYVDIIAEDIYTQPYDYESHYILFEKAIGYSETNKLIALSETGVMPDPLLMYSDNSRWLFFALWNGEFILNSDRSELSEECNEFSHIKYVIDHEKIITFDELPKLEQYPID